MPSSNTQPTPAIQLSDFLGIVPPVGWAIAVEFDNLPFRLMGYGRIVFRPQGIDRVCLVWQLVNWLDGQPEWWFLKALLDRSVKLGSEAMERLYPKLIRIPVQFLTDFRIADHAGLGRVLTVDYDHPDLRSKGRILYGQSPTGDADLQMISYEGAEPSYSEHRLEAIEAILSLRRTG